MFLHKSELPREFLISKMLRPIFVSRWSNNLFKEQLQIMMIIEIMQRIGKTLLRQWKGCIMVEGRSRLQRQITPTRSNLVSLYYSFIILFIKSKINSHKNLWLLHVSRWNVLPFNFPDTAFLLFMLGRAWVSSLQGFVNCNQWLRIVLIFSQINDKTLL